MTEEVELDMEDGTHLGRNLGEDGVRRADDGGNDDGSSRLVRDILCGDIQSIPGQLSSVYRIFLSSTFTGYDRS